ncbi:MAG: exodeoxyribonuclease VII large subunit [Endomicrobium sp.]|jgi:exodeoxyribonuclease VII large subunit|nr:exodeoxyribonuclease VII large subunit [Endomicrobium sp.]
MLEETDNNDNDGRLIYTVSQISAEIKLILEESYPCVWVQGEISNFKFYNSGYMYFSVKDANAHIKAVMFQNVNVGLTFAPQDGMKVLVYGRVSAYPKYGDYQIIVNHMERYGKGELYDAHEKLKKKLDEEGLFDKSVKKTIPNIVNKIGVVTSQDGAVLHDILRVIDNLKIGVEVLICPARVQRKAAEKEIPRAIKYLNDNYKDLDVLLIGRGGGSIEDLWAFNTEVVARAIFNSKIPTVSCVGHEVDFTIADFVADMRAPTASAAAEMVLRQKNFISCQVEQLKCSLKDSTDIIFNRNLQNFERLKSSRSLQRPHLIYEDKISYVDDMSERLKNNVERFFETKFEKLKNISHKLNILSPLSVLERGFSICFNGDNKIVKNSKDVKQGDIVNVKLASGGFNAEIKSYD